MGVISKVKDGRLLLSGEINERLPMVTDGLLVYYPLDGTLNSDRHSLQGIKAYVINMQSSSHTLMNWLINKGVDVTYDDGDGTSWAGWAIFDAISEATLLATYDLIVVDGYVWSISTTHVNKLKSLAEQGMACMGQGNDTRNNVFAISTTAIGTETDNNGTTLDDISYITGVPDGSIVGNTSVDPNFYIDTLSGLCTPLYYHNTVGANGIMGYIYEPSGSNGSFYFDEFGFAGNNTYSNIVENILKYQISKSTNRIANVNNTLNSEGLAVEVGTTNLATNPLDYTQWSKANIPSEITLTGGQLDSFGLNNAVLFQADAGSQYPHIRWINIISGNTNKHTLSVYLKNSGGSSRVDLVCFRASPWATAFSKTLTITDEWVRYDVTGVPLDNTGHYYCIMNNKVSSDNMKFLMAYPQAEEKEYLTAFIDGTRAGSGGFAIPNPVTTGDFTINFKCGIDTHVGDVGGYRTIMSMGSYYTNNSWTIMDQGSPNVSGTQAFIRKGNAEEWAWGFTYTSSSNVGDDNVYTVVKDGTVYKGYLNGVYRGSISHLSTTLQDLIWIGSRESGTYVATSRIKDLSIYNRVLTDDEILLNVNGGPALNDETLNIKNIIEMEGWTHIYGGPHFYLSDETDHDAIDYEHPGSDALLFDMMMIKPRYFNNTDDLPFYVGTFTETCVLSEPYRHYTSLLAALPDTSGRKLLCKAVADGLVDVDCGSNYLGYCYGNGYRRYADMWYIAGTTSYIGAYPAFGVTYSDWGVVYADAYTTQAEMLNDTLIESGLGLTPLKSCMIDVYVKLGTETGLDKISNNDSIILKRELIEEGV